MQYEAEINGRSRLVIVARDDGGFVVSIDGRSWRVDAARIDRHTLSLLVADADTGIRLKPHAAAGAHEAGRTVGYEVTVARDPATARLAVRVGATPVFVGLESGRRWRRKDEQHGGGSGPQRVVAPMPGKIVRVLVQTGEAVHARQPLVVIEAMKMENELRTARDGTVSEVHVREGASVDAGSVLLVIT